MCGEDSPIVATIETEGARMRVCARCVRFGKVVTPPSPAGPAAPASSPTRGLEQRERWMTERPVPLEADEEVVEDFGERVRHARERRRVTLDDLARAVNEKKSILAKVETGAFHPDPQLARKLEAALGIKLREKVEEVHTQKFQKKGGVTIGDLIKMKKE
jgi:putative transcription factor